MSLGNIARDGVPAGMPDAAYPTGTVGALKNNIYNYDLNDPNQYMAAALDVNDYNNQTSQAMAREQMNFQREMNALAMDFNASEAQKVRDWQTMMSNTAHQREVADLLKAGLNPILSANNGAAVGSSPAGQVQAPSGAKGSVDMSAVSALTGVFTKLKELQMQDRSLELQNKQIDAQLLMNTISAQTNKYMADRSANASMYSAGAMASANRYAAELSQLASMYSADLNYDTWSQGYHNEFGQLVNFFGDLFGLNDQTTPSGKKLNLGELFAYSLKGKSLFGNSNTSGAELIQNPNYIYRDRGKSVGNQYK